MLNEHAVSLRVKFKPPPNELAIDVGVFSSVDQLHNESTIVLANTDGFKGVERYIWKHLKDEELVAQNPKCVCKRLTNLQSRKVNAVRNTQGSMEEVLDLE